MCDLYSGKHILLGIAEETVFGSPVADGNAFIQLSCESAVIAPDIKHRAPNRAQGRLLPDKANLWNDTKGSVPSITLKTVALKQELALWLYLVMQNVAEAATTPYQKTFTFPLVGPDFLSSAGEFITLISKAPVASVSEKVTSMVADKLEFTLSAGADDGNLACSIGLIGKGHSRTSNPSGTWTKTTDARYNFHDFNLCTLDGQSLILESVKIGINTVLVPKGSNGAGSFQTFVTAGQSVDLEISGLWDANSRAGLTALDAGTEVIFILGWGTTGVDGYLKFTIHGIVESGAPVEGDSRLVNLKIKGMYDVSANPDDEPITVEVADAKDWTW
jgi:hypothetical protein